MSLQNQTNSIFPWDYQIGDENFQKEPWILNKGKEYVTIEKNVKNKGFFYLQKNEEKRLSLNLVQTKSTYNKMIEFGYKLRINKI
ncbi:cytochrome oxidase C subunit VIb-like protein [Prochlorococcus marinus str. MIT 9312]|uniref:Cytochrome oxidase C subunit VIb-like protein n=1 Tax=Prochlorococcus marinus (strain MIT 9312) TaxID=74546 RepID=Q31A75_PROM9|nr:hypothetical protein [Prochlorococcus marinus]ABB50220.1 cytochrome oxidase C subunit VIb-like protein [Prochlorococcus marinus str. MIT 9312]KGG01613.1 putative Cytochrome oxidase c subunit VIb [Prochlorococcus marinus str. MIT 9311]